MSKVKESMRMALVIAAALALTAVAGILVTYAEDSPVIWKQHCPAQHEVRLEKAEDWGGVHVLCVRLAEEGRGAK